MTTTIEVDEATLPEGTEHVELIARGSWKGKEAPATITINVRGDLELRLY